MGMSKTEIIALLIILAVVIGGMASLLVITTADLGDPDPDDPTFV